MPVQPDLRAIKGEAKGLLQTAAVPPVKFTLLFLAIDLVLELVSSAASYMLNDTIGFASYSFSFVGILISLLSSVLLAGYMCYCLGVHRGLAMPYDSLFDAFPFAGKVIMLEVLQGLMIGLGLMLFVIPGVILSFSYSFSLFHICENPEISVIDAMRRSRLEMQGYKAQLFLLVFSFFPLLLLASAATTVPAYFLRGLFPDTLGGSLLRTFCLSLLLACVEAYLTPYMTLSQVGFYRRVTENAEQSGNSPDGRGPEL